MTIDAKTLSLQVAEINWKEWTDEDVDWGVMWKSFLDTGDDDLRQHLVEGQSEIVSLAAVPLTPILIAFARSELPHHHLALRVLASILFGGGRLEYQERQAGRDPYPNPFKPGEMVATSHPAPSDLAKEARRIHKMKLEIEAEIEDWIHMATTGTPEVSLESLGLLAEVIHSPQLELAEETIESVFESADQAGRDELSWVMERMEMAKQCSFCLSRQPS